MEGDSAPKGSNKTAVALIIGALRDPQPTNFSPHNPEENKKTLTGNPERGFCGSE